MKSKKIICSLAAILSLGVVVAGCNEEIIPIDEHEALIAASEGRLASIGQSYTSWSQSAGLAKDGTLIKERTYDGYIFEVSYTVAALGTYNSPYATIEGNKLKVTVPQASVDEPETVEYVAYKLTGKMKFKGYDETYSFPAGLTRTETYLNEELDTMSWNIRINCKKTFIGSLAQLYDAYNRNIVNSDYMVITQGVIGPNTASATYTTNSMKYNLFLDDGDYTLCLYDKSSSTDSSIYETYPVGTKVKVKGSFTTYYGVLELTQYTIEIDNTLNVSSANTLNLGTNFVDSPSYSARLARATGKVVGIDFSHGDAWEYGIAKANVHLNLTGAMDKKDNTKLATEMDAYVYYADGEQTYATWVNSGITKTSFAGDIVVEGRYNWYNGLPELYMCKIVSYTPSAA